MCLGGAGAGAARGRFDIDIRLTICSRNKAAAFNRLKVISKALSFKYLDSTVSEETCAPYIGVECELPKLKTEFNVNGEGGKSVCIIHVSFDWSIYVMHVPISNNVCLSSTVKKNE